jgi:putative ABC transport system permease protein
VKTLDRKLLRDLWRMRGQAIAIAVVLAAATATFVMSTGVHGSLEVTRDAYYERNNFAEVFADMTRAPRSVVARVEDIAGVRAAEGTIRQYATLDFPDRIEPVRALINSVAQGGNDLNRLTLRTGRMPRPGHPGEALVDEAFAEANALGPGDTVDGLVYGRKQRLEITGIALSPEFLYALPPGDIVPDESRFGIFWMGEEALEAATDRTEAINTLAVKLEHGASEPDVIRKIDALLEPYGGTGAFGRKDQLSNAFLDTELQQLAAMTQVIPPVFLLVATFLVYIVLGRMIRTERTQIGLMKAVGYSDWAVAWHYLKFALTIAAAATLLGWAAGIWMGRGMTGIYASFYRFPFLEYRMSPAVFVGAGALAFGAAALGAIAGMRGAVTLAPAVAMAPPPPPVYSSGRVERLGQAAGFTAIGHMIVRHIARWPGRSAITVTGVSLSLALLFSVMQMLDSSDVMLDSAFFRSQRQDVTVSFIEPRNEDAIHALAQMPGVLRAEPMRAVAVKISKGNLVERISIEGAEPEGSLSARIDGGGGEVGLPAAGLMLSSQLAGKLGVEAGGMVHVELLGGRRTQAFMPVASIVEEFIGKRAYAANDTLLTLTRDASPAGAALLRIDSAHRERLLQEFKEMPMVLGVTERDAALIKFEEMIDESFFTMMFLYIGFASAIAVGVVYNSARILFSERAHELATLRVLGYHRSEVGVVLIGELALLVLAAVPLGCLLGTWLSSLMMQMFASDLYRLPFAPSRASYGFATLVVLIAAGATALLVARRVANLDMVRVLKARD